MLYILVNENFESVLSGSDSLIQIDGRLNKHNKNLEAEKHLERLKAVKPHLKNEAHYIAQFKSTYVNGKYIYKNNLIKL